MDPRSVPVSHGPVLVAGRYELLSALSRGGMGEVFVALDRASGQTVALKRLRAQHIRRQQILAHFTAEYHALSRLKHPRIIEVFDFGVHDDVPFYTMELLDGEDLRELGAVRHEEACRYLRDVASSLALLHAQRLLHRDLSPRNIRRTNDGRCKLFDFGTMTPFGVPPDVAGTAPFVPPEAADCGFLDQRADLFSLGALAYWMLTGRHAYAAAKLEDLPALWPRPVERVRSLEPSVPEALEALVMSLLSLDPRQRPSTAAEVIERLNAVAQLASDGDADVAQGYIASTKLCGRHEPMGRLHSLIDRSLHGGGSAVLIEGTAGIGKSRMLDELTRVAQTRGLMTLRAFVSSEHAGHSLVDQLSRALKRALPHAAESQTDDAAAKGSAQSAMGNDNLMGFELRAREQQRLNELFVCVTRERPVLIVIDDLDRADEFSAALVAGLAHQTRDLALSIVASIGDDRKPNAASAIAAFGSASELLRLQPLDAMATRELVSGVVGEVPNLERLIDWLERGARGNPGLTIELIQLLVKRGLVRYVDGTWALPDDEIHERIPHDMAGMLTTRLESLSVEARELADVVALLGRDAPLELCLLISGASHKDTLFALNELMAEEVFVGARGGYRLAQEVLRDALEQQLDDARRRALHSAIGKALLSLPKTPERDLEAGIHLVRTEDDLRGAELIAKAASSLIREGRAWGAAIFAMEHALAVFERRKAPLRKSLSLRQQLVLCGYLYDYKLALRHGEETLRQLSQLVALSFIQTLTHYLGPKLGLVVALVLGVLRKPFSSVTRSAPNIYSSLILLGRTVMGLVGVRATSLDRAGTQRLADYVAPLGHLKFTGLESVDLSCKTFALQVQGRESELAVAVQEALRSLERPRVGMSAIDRLDLKAGLLLSGGINECYRIGSQALVRADELEALGTRIAVASADRIRMTYYLVRGDRERAETFRKKIELHAIQGGTSWQVEWFAVPIEGMSATRYGDMVGARRALNRLRELSDEHPSLRSLRDMVAIGYLAHRGELQAAVELGERFVADHAPHTVIGWGNAYADLAAAYNGLGNHQRAREICELGMAAVSEADREYMIMYGPLELEWSVAMVALGFEDEAATIESDWIRRLQDAGEYHALVMLREKRVQAAVLLHDQDAIQASLSALVTAAEQTEVASMIAHAARVSQQFASRSQTLALESELQSEDAADETTIDAPRRNLSPLQRLLHELWKITEADAVHLYRDDSGSPVAAVGAHGELPAQVLDAVDNLTRARPGSGIVPVNAHAQMLHELRALSARGYLLKSITVASSRTAVVVLAHPQAAWGYDSVLEELGILLSEQERSSMVGC